MASTTCLRCNRALKDPVSRKAGLGPVCRAIAVTSDSGELLDDQPVLNGVGALRDVGLVCRRLANGEPAANVPHVVVHHSPTGFEWGYSGSGPAELALNVLAILLPHSGGLDPWNTARLSGTVSNDAWILHQDFKARFIATLPAEGGHVAIEDINAWIAERLVREAA
jgi:hypothetical protein